MQPRLTHGRYRGFLNSGHLILVSTLSVTLIVTTIMAYHCLAFCPAAATETTITYPALNIPDPWVIRASHYLAGTMSWQTLRDETTVPSIDTNPRHTINAEFIILRPEIDRHSHRDKLPNTS